MIAPGTDLSVDAVAAPAPAPSADPIDAHRWARLAALGQRIVDGLDQPALEQAVVDAARELLGTDLAGYAEIGVDPPSFRIRAMAAAPGRDLPSSLVGAEIALDLTAIGEPLIRNVPFIVIDVATAPPTWAAVMRRFGVTEGATVIVGRQDRPLGIIGVATSGPRTFDGEDIAITQALASLLASALDRAAGERALDARIHQQEALADLGSRVIAGLGLPQLAVEVVEGLSRTHGPDIVGIARVADGGRRFELIAGKGLEPDDLGPALLTPGGLGAAVVASDEPIVLADLRSGPPGRRSPVLDELGMTSLVLARIGDPDRLWGLLGMADRRPGRFGQEDAAFVRSLANLLASAVALERATEAVADQARNIEQARFDERTALAREIHDGLVQDLWLARLRHGLLADAVADGTEVEPRLAELGTAIDRAGESARQAVMSLRGGEGDAASLAGDLATYAGDVGRRLGIPIETRTGPDLPDLPPRVQAELLRIVQEILTNAARHAAPTHVVLKTSTDRRGLRIVVRDDGRGFDPDLAAANGIGLTGMRERAALIGAAVAVRSAEGRGTTITVTLPRRAWGGPHSGIGR